MRPNPTRQWFEQASILDWCAIGLGLLGAEDLKRVECLEVAAQAG
jgi:hypothetical protein